MGYDLTPQGLHDLAEGAAVLGTGGGGDPYIGLAPGGAGDGRQPPSTRHRRRRAARRRAGAAVVDDGGRRPCSWRSCPPAAATWPPSALWKSTSAAGRTPSCRPSAAGSTA
ncbi:hypothetical protein ACFSTC_32010 [Nonomuraea ferruginea]